MGSRRTQHSRLLPRAVPAGEIAVRAPGQSLFHPLCETGGGDAALVLTQPLPTAAPTQPAEAKDAGIDLEMLDVFLEEANEVLGAIESASTELNKSHDDHDALLSIRRAFHTLKGSARMVGLAAFGECAWEMEQLMNHWRAQSQAATPELLVLVKDARELLAEWAYALQGGEEPAADPAGIAVRARCAARQSRRHHHPCRSPTPPQELPRSRYRRHPSHSNRYHPRATS